MFEWGRYYLVLLRSRVSGETLGLLGLWAETSAPVPAADKAQFLPEELLGLGQFAARASSALEDRRLQRDVFTALDRLLPQIEAIQRMRAAAAYPHPANVELLESAELASLIKEALSHYWGGPKLLNSPLMQLQVVEQALREHDGNAANALRAVLARAVERLKPEGQRKFTAEWVLYNILELKFMQDLRVRDVALRLALSEADLYRKQRIALEEVAAAIRDMERDATRAAPPPNPN